MRIARQFRGIVRMALAVAVLTWFLLPVLVPLALLLMVPLGMSRSIPVVARYALPQIIVPLGFLLLFAVRLRSGPKYKALFADNHLIELAGRLAKAKAACLLLLAKPYEGTKQFRDEAAQEQGNLFETSAHLSVYYSIDREGVDYRHHISLAHLHGALALSAGQQLAAIIGELLHVNLLERASMWQGNRTVFHISFALDEKRELEFAVSQVRFPTTKELPELRSRARQTVQRLRELARTSSALSPA